MSPLFCGGAVFADSYSIVISDLVRQYRHQQESPRESQEFIRSFALSGDKDGPKAGRKLLRGSC